MSWIIHQNESQGVAPSTAQFLEEHDKVRQRKHADVSDADLRDNVAKVRNRVWAHRRRQIAGCRIGKLQVRDHFELNHIREKALLDSLIIHFFKTKLGVPILGA